MEPLAYLWSLCPTHLEGDGASGRLGTSSQHVVLGAPLLTGDEDDGALLVPGLDEAQEVRHARVDTEKHHHLQRRKNFFGNCPTRNKPAMPQKQTRQPSSGGVKFQRSGCYL